MDSKEVDGVEVILIYDDKKLLDRSDVKKLLNFFSAEEGYTCKVALLNDFKTVCESNGVSSQFVDFGIYGPKMLYITEHISQYIKEHIIKMRQEFGIIRGCLTRFGIRM